MFYNVLYFFLCEVSTFNCEIEVFPNDYCINCYYIIKVHGIMTECFKEMQYDLMTSFIISLYEICTL